MIKKIKQLLPDSLKLYIWKAKQRLRRTSKVKKSSFPHSKNNVLNCLIAYNKYGGYCTPLSSQHRPAVQKILRGEVHEPKTIEYILTNYAGGDIVHAGTYFGDFLPALSSNVSDKVKVWAFEPNPESFRCASITKLINNIGNIELMNAGLGENTTKARMSVKDSNNKARGGESYILKSDSGPEETIDIQIESIDNVVPIERKVSIIQLDVEGFEIFALKGAKKTIEKWKPILILENLPEQQWLVDNIFSLGYKIEGKVHLNTILKC